MVSSTPSPPPASTGASSGGSAAALARAVAGVDQALDAPRRAGIPLGNWRWLVRQRATVLREALTSQSGTGQDGWLAARGGAAFRERTELLSRVSALSQEVLDSPDVERTRADFKRMLIEVRRHLGRADDPGAGRRTE